jgi:hypothetical protein
MRKYFKFQIPEFIYLYYRSGFLPEPLQPRVMVHRTSVVVVGSQTLHSRFHFLFFYFFKRDFDPHQREKNKSFKIEGKFITCSGFTRTKPRVYDASSSSSVG